MQFTARNYENGELICVTVDGEHIASVEPVTPDADIADYPYIAPGLFDLQINGHGEIWFSKEGLTPDDVINTLGAHFPFVDHTAPAFGLHAILRHQVLGDQFVLLLPSITSLSGTFIHCRNAVSVLS